MNKSAVIIVILLCLFVATANARQHEYYLKFSITDRADIAKLTHVLSIDNVRDLTVYAYANDDQLKIFDRMGYAYEILPAPGTLIKPEMSADKLGIAAWDVYPTYDAYVAMMYQFAADYPGLCTIVDAGLTTEGRSILFARISDNVNVEEDEPEVMYTSSMHGDELTGYVLTLRLIDSILTSYGTDPRITRLVDSCEIWINPLANPDGTYASGNSTVYGATRYNANGVDINRNFPDPQDGPHPDGYSYQAETIDMMNLGNAHSFVISANFHGGAEVVNYPWDTWSRLHVDNDWFVDISRQFADSAQYYSPNGYLTDLNNGITNGYAWYEVQGGRQDFMNYWRGCREVTIEISGTKLLPASSLPAYWTYLRTPFLDYLEHALYGIRGIVTDASTGEPVFATVRILDHDSDLDSSRVFSDPDIGDYHRMLEPGTYDVEFSAPGYYLKTVKSVPVYDRQSTRRDVQLTPLPNIPDLTFLSQDAGSINAGDVVSMNVTLINNGAGNGTGINAALSTTDPYIIVTQATAAFPTITALGGTGTSLTPYGFSVDPLCPMNHPAQFDLNITADGGYDTTVSFDVTIGQVIEDFESGGFASLPWQMSGSLGWTLTSSAPYEGIYTAKSGAITDNQYSQMAVTLDISTAGNISFHYRVSSEVSYDYLRFLIDGVEQDKWSGEVAWSTASYAVSAGSHTFAWKYTKDVSLSNGSDCGWVDYIVFPPVTLPAPSITTTSLPDWTAGHPFSEQLEASGGTGTLSWTDKNGDLAGSGLILSSAGLLSGTPVYPGLPGTISFTALVTDQALATDERVFEFTIAPAPEITTDTLPTGNINEVYSQQLTGTGGTGTISWSDAGGDLATTGLTLSTSGVLSGTVTDTMTIDFTARATDAVGASADKQLQVLFIRPYMCGDANGDKVINIGDATYLVNYIFKGGSAPDPIESGDADGNGDDNIGDAVYLINYIFKGGSDPLCP